VQRLQGPETLGAAPTRACDPGCSAYKGLRRRYTGFRAGLRHHFMVSCLEWWRAIVFHPSSAALSANCWYIVGMPQCECPAGPAGTSPNSDSGPDSAGLRAGLRRHFMVRIHSGMSSYHAFIAYQERAGMAPVTESKNVTDLK
jgi:hypothetical protein